MFCRYLVLFAADTIHWETCGWQFDDGEGKANTIVASRMLGRGRQEPGLRSGTDVPLRCARYKARMQALPGLD